MTPACAKACPTESIQFGDLENCAAMPKARVEKLQPTECRKRIFTARIKKASREPKA